MSHQLTITTEEFDHINQTIESTNDLSRTIRENGPVDDATHMSNMNSTKVREFDAVIEPYLATDFSPRQLDIMKEKKWLRPGETKDDACRRVARWLSMCPERRLASLASTAPSCTTAYTEEVFYALLSNFIFIPNSPCWTGANTPGGKGNQLAACFVFDIDDTTFRDPKFGPIDNSIMSVLNKAVAIQKQGGGCGFDFSRLRPKGSPIASSNGISPGPIRFIKLYNDVFDGILQGGIRRGANMAVLRVDHPDIIDFITCKVKSATAPDGTTHYVSNETYMTAFNISVGITDEFVRACEDDGPFNLVFNGRVYKTVRARDIMRLISTMAHRGGEPGVLFLDTANRMNPMPGAYDATNPNVLLLGGPLNATNPCGEQFLPAHSNCNLGHLNLAAMARDMDLDRWSNIIKASVYMLHANNFINAYIKEYPEFYRTAHGERRLGLGITGLADMLIQLGLVYGSKEANGFLCYLMHYVVTTALITSVQIATEDGAFPYSPASELRPGSDSYMARRYRKFLSIDENYMNEFSDGISNAYVRYCPANLRAKFDEWRLHHYRDILKETLANFNRVGMAHCTLTTVAPTGTCSCVAGTEGFGCEPIFGWYHIRHMVLNDGENTRKALEYKSGLLTAALERSGLSAQEVDRVYSEISHGKKLSEISGVPSNVASVFVDTQSLTLTQHIQVLGIVTQFVCNSVSKTCNAPEETTPDDIERAIYMAHRIKCKGFTVYVQGSRDKVVLEEKKSVVPSVASVPVPTEQLVKEPRRKRIEGVTCISSFAGNKMRMTMNFVDGVPFEVFIFHEEVGSDLGCILTCYGRMISCSLRMHKIDNRNECMDHIVEEMKKSIKHRNRNRFGMQESVISHIVELIDECRNPKKTCESLVQSCDGDGDKYEMCPSCGEHTLLRVEQCFSCINCSHSFC